MNLLNKVMLFILIAFVLHTFSFGVGVLVYEIAN